jgi:hypothetical protein
MFKPLASSMPSLVASLAAPGLRQTPHVEFGSETAGLVQGYRM